MGVFSDVLEAYSTHREAEQSRDWNETESRRSREWQEEMANTQYQRMVQDLSAAGLSPMLAYSKTASNVPSGATASSSAMGQGLKLGESERRESQSALAREQVKLANEQAAVASSQVQVNSAQAEKLKAETSNINQDTQNKGAPFQGLNEATVKELLARIPTHGASAEHLSTLVKEIVQSMNLRKPEEEFKGENPNVAKYMHPIQESLRTIFEGLGLLRGSSAMPFVTKNAPRGK